MADRRLAPVVLFAYNRVDHLARTVASLLKNTYAAETDLIVFSDAPRNLSAEHGVSEVRDYLVTIKGFRSVTIKYREKNFGLAKSIIDGVTQVLAINEHVIVLEDDMETSEFFLAYMNEGLNRFSADKKIASIHGYMYPINDLPEYFFMPGSDCWGWATWRDRWSLFEPNASLLLRRLIDSGKVDSFNRTGGSGLVFLLVMQILGRIDSWFIRWHASTFLAGLITLYPGRSFIRNIGTDNSGSHGDDTDAFNVVLRSDFSSIPELTIAPNERVVHQVEDFFVGKALSPFRRFLRWLVVKIFFLKIAITKHGNGLA